MDRTFKFSPRLKKPKFQFSFQTQKGNGSSAGAANAADAQMKGLSLRSVEQAFNKFRARHKKIKNGLGRSL